jgi:hypothetical protein
MLVDRVGGCKSTLRPLTRWKSRSVSSFNSLASSMASFIYYMLESLGVIGRCRKIS